jgi:hypothetical protein
MFGPQGPNGQGGGLASLVKKDDWGLFLGLWCGAPSF